jgi:hypothetical protein
MGCGTTSASGRNQPVVAGKNRLTPATGNFSFLGDMRMKTLLALYLLTACASTFAQNDRPVSCKQLVRSAIADEVGRTVKTETRERELCFPGEQDCLNQGGIAAEDIWKSANEPDEVKSALLNYADYRGQVSEVDMPGEGGKIVRIGRFVGSSYCIRDTYFLYQNGTYRLIDSPSLEELSAEAANCGDAKITLDASDGPLLVTKFYGVLAAYRFADDFALRKVCSQRYRASRLAQ